MFIGLARTRLDRASLALERLDRDPRGDLTVDLRRELHTLRGEANLLALTHIAEVAGRAEDLLLFNGAEPRSAALEIDAAKALLEEGLALCRQMVDALPDRELRTCRALDFLDRADALLYVRTK
jgi:chemotaxis protein histidine kinase CheA